MLEEAFPSFPPVVLPSHEQLWSSEPSHLGGEAEINLRRDSQKLRRDNMIGRSRDFSPSSGCDFEMIFDQGSSADQLHGLGRPGDLFSNREEFG